MSNPTAIFSNAFEWMIEPMSQTSFAAVDWGTSSFRLWCCSADGKVIRRHHSSKGMFHLRTNEFAPYLDGVLSELGEGKDVPVVVCGMAGARGGWMEAPYAHAPATSGDIASKIVFAEGSKHKSAILPGVSLVGDKRFDVMRGEETLIFGALSLEASDGIFCLPGTHSKWCRVTDGAIADWSTAMTGEIFGLLSKQSTLSDFCTETGEAIYSTAAFKEAVTEALRHPNQLTHLLFSIRSRSLLAKGEEAQNMRARLYGLLVGCDIAGVRFDLSDSVTLVASEQLGNAYQTALSLAGYSSVLIDTERAALAGLSNFAHQILEI